MKRGSKGPEAEGDVSAGKRRHIDRKKHVTNTLYVTNLNSGVSTADLKVALYLLFSSYGHVIAINAHRLRLRGRAFVSFGNSAAALVALDRLQGRLFLGKHLEISQARSPSERIELTRVRAKSVSRN